MANKYKLRSLEEIRKQVREILDLYLLRFKGATKENVYYRARNLAADASLDMDDLQPGETKEHLMSRHTANVVAYLACIDDVYGKILHYYIPDDALVEFLETTEVRDVMSLKVPDRQSFDFFFVHTHKHVYLIHNALSQENEMVITVYKDDDWINGSPDVKGTTLKEFMKFVKSDKRHIMTFAINLLYYMRAFPEEIKAGLPEDMCKTDRTTTSKQKRCSIGTTPKIVESSIGSTLAPHFRRGFFRTFSSDRYVNMKGKTIFIEGTMVRGHLAKTVENKNSSK